MRMMLGPLLCCWLLAGVAAQEPAARTGLPESYYPGDAGDAPDATDLRLDEQVRWPDVLCDCAAELAGEGVLLQGFGVRSCEESFWIRRFANSSVARKFFRAAKFNSDYNCG